MMAKNSGDIPRAKMLNDKINEMQAEIIRLKNMGRTGMAGGGESSFRRRSRQDDDGNGKSRKSFKRS
jgi:hypothetical protein